MTAMQFAEKKAAYRVGALVGAAALMLASCATDSDSEPKTKFESGRHGYALELPEKWEVTEYDGAWTSVAQVTPPGEVPGEDVASSPDGSGWLVVNSMAIPDEMSPADWLGRLERRVKLGLGEDCPLVTDSDVLAGEPARTGSNQCNGMTVVGRSLAHAGRGYYFTIGYPTGDSATESALEGIVASIRFVDQ